MNPKRKPPRKKTPPSAKQIAIRRAGSTSARELVHPRSVARRADDLEEVRAMLAAGEIDVAEDELRWLVGGCSVLLEGHKLLGQIAAGDKNWELARAHFAYAYQLGLDAATRAKHDGTLPYALTGNRDLHEAGRGLAEALLNLDQRDLARQIIDQLLVWDPTDPLGVKELRNS